MIKSIFYFFIAFFLFSACDSKDEEKSVGGDPLIDKCVYAIVKDSNGNDLFDPSVDGYINPTNSRLYAVVNGEEQICYGKNDLAPYCVNLSDEKYNDRHFATIYLVNHPENGTSEEIIKWTETLTDTIVCKLDVNNNIQKVYVNGELAFDKSIANSDGRYITFNH